MSSLCQAAHSILALHDEDLHMLNSVPGNSNRRIDINLDCNFTGSGPGNSNCKLDVVSWENGATDLCGSCSFCKMLADGMQQSVESDQWYAWNLSSKLDPITLSQPFNMRATVRLDKLEYQKHRAPRTVDNFSIQSTSRYRETNLLLLNGHMLLYPKNIDTGEEPERIEVPLTFELFGEEDGPVVQLLGIHRRSFDGPRLSDENVAKMDYWIKDCDENHERCFPNLKNLDDKKIAEAMTFLPTRMIDVGDNGRHPQLVITSKMPTRTPKDEASKYMALSYCWGQIDGESKLLKTTHDTIRSRTEKIEMSTMPRVFQEAIIVARKLNIPYLWIDSLCIIQDDARDWQIESSKMAEIFNNAYLTLIAATGSGCNDSFLSRGLPGLSCTITLCTNQGLAIQGQFSVRFRPDRKSYDKMTEIRGSKWITRGWTFQEERLARRVLIFGERKFFFDCRTVERAQDTLKYLPRPDWVTSVTEGLSEDHGNGPESIDAAKRWDHWQTLCTDYSYRKLTFPEDKLPAISGMANKIGKKIQSEYLAGLWRQNLMHDLFWQTWDDVITRPRSYRAPSWSWASLDGKIDWPLRCDLLTRGECSTYCIILEAKTTLFGLDPYGAVKEGFLKIRGVIEEMELTRVGGDESQHPWRLYHEGEVIGNVNLDMDDDSAKVYGRANMYYALLVAGCKAREASNITIRGLLLKKNGYKREDCEEFERVGTFALCLGIIPGQIIGSRAIWDRDIEQLIMIV